MTDLLSGKTSQEHDSESGPKPVTASDIRLSAMNLLARREHSRQELRRKLQRRFDDEQALDAVLKRLADENLQSDTRFAESFVRQRSARGYGPLRVRQEMREKGLKDADISQACAAADIDWYTLAAGVFEKKFGGANTQDVREKSRRARFMQYRGFSSEHYRHLLED